MGHEAACHNWQSKYACFQIPVLHCLTHVTLLEINVWRQTWGEKITSFKEALLNLWFIQILMSFDSTWFVVIKRHLTVGSSTKAFSVAVVFHVWELVLLFEACCFCFYFSSLPCLGVWGKCCFVSRSGRSPPPPSSRSSFSATNIKRAHTLTATCTHTLIISALSSFLLFPSLSRCTKANSADLQAARVERHSG